MNVMLLIKGSEWKLGCPKSPTWETEGEAWSEDESVRDDNVCNEALQFIGCMGLVTRSLSQRLGACKGGIELSHGPRHTEPGNA